MARRMKLSEHMTALGQRLDRLEVRFERFEAKVDERFDELRRHFDVIAEASRDDFRNLYDLLQAHMARTDVRIDTSTVDLRAEMKLGYGALDSRVTVLERSEQARSKPRRR